MNGEQPITGLFVLAAFATAISTAIDDTLLVSLCGSDLAFASSGEAAWQGNFRELSASITRMATLADSGRIDEAQVEEEITRLRRAWGLAQ